MYTVGATFLQFKKKNNELERKLQWAFKIHVSYDSNQTTLGNSSTIHHPLTDVKGQKICSNGQQAKSVDCSSIFSPEKLDSVIQVSSDRNQSTWATVQPFSIL